MPNTREKLIELLLAAFEKCYSTICVRGDRRCKEYNEDERTTDRSCQARLFADHLIANGVTIQSEPLTNCQQSVGDKWVSTAERLPEGMEWVLCTCRNNEVYILAYDFIMDDWDIWGRPNTCYGKQFVTHWMPLPEPPKGE